MELHVVIDGDKDLSGQLYRQLHDAIRSDAACAERRTRLLRRFADDLSPWFELVPATG